MQCFFTSSGAEGQSGEVRRGRGGMEMLEALFVCGGWRLEAGGWRLVSRLGELAELSWLRGAVGSWSRGEPASQEFPRRTATPARLEQTNRRPAATPHPRRSEASCYRPTAIAT